MKTALLTIISLIACSWLSMDWTSYPVVEKPSLREGKDYALFFAVDDYRNHANFDNLNNPIGDAHAIATELKEMYAFDTHVYENPTQRQIWTILAQWQQRSFQPDDQLFIFFSGHGDFDEFVKKGYFLTHGRNERIDLTDLGNIITQIPCEHILLAIDACYSGTIDQEIAFRSGNWSRPKITANHERDRLISNLLRNKSRLLVTSGGKERTPDGKEHSPFADAFIKGLKAAYSSSDGLFSFQDLLARLERVSPKPHEGSLLGHDEGGFVFVTESPIFPEQPALVSVPPVKDQQTTRPSATTAPDNFVRILGGTFQMGDQYGEGDDDEKPVHTVEVSTFYLSPTEVTFAEYDAFCTATGRDKPSDSGWGRDQRPAINVSWCDAVEYANWLSTKNGLQTVYSGNCDNIRANWEANGYRLPTEAEWEYAARQGGQKVRFGNGKDIADPAEINFDASADYKKSYSRVGTYRRQTVPVGSLNSPNSLGLHDMSGNVYEWCWDWFDSDYYKNSPRNNPQGPTSGSDRVKRGGSWIYYPAYVRCAIRYYVSPGFRYYFIGFRLARAGR
jgi:formylglycine-generating enzyme required for sulfatase activity